MSGQEKKDSIKTNFVNTQLEKKNSVNINFQKKYKKYEMEEKRGKGRELFYNFNIESVNIQIEGKKLMKPR